MSPDAGEGSGSARAGGLSWVSTDTSLPRIFQRPPIFWIERDRVTILVGTASPLCLDGNDASLPMQTMQNGTESGLMGIAETGSAAL